MHILSYTTRLIVSIAVCLLVVLPSFSDEPVKFSPYGDAKGNITRPKNFATKWAHLGSVAATNKKGEDVASVHSTYTQPESLRVYQKTGKFPGGATIIKEVRNAAVSELTTGRVARQEEVDVWFVMIKDTKRRFKTNAHWGNGWGWALYEAKAPEKNVSKGYEKSCIGCHTPVEETDWLHVETYPRLRRN